MEESVTREPLTPRELEGLGLLTRGLDNSEIAQALYLSQHTVKNHVSTILNKLQVENRIQAAVRADVGVLDVDELQPGVVPGQPVPGAVAVEHKICAGTHEKY